VSRAVSWYHLYKPARGAPDAGRWARSYIMVHAEQSSNHISANPGDLLILVVLTVGRAKRPSSAMPRPNSACSRRRHRQFTNMYSFTWPWRFSVVRSAARLRRGVGRSRIPIHRAAQSGQPDNQVEHPSRSDTEPERTSSERIKYGMRRKLLTHHPKEHCPNA